MEQLTFFEAPYKYIIDASSILSQKSDRDHRRIIYRNMWDRIDDLIRREIIVTSSEIMNEVQDEDLIDWAERVALTVIKADDEEIQQNLIHVVTTAPRLVDFHAKKSSGDAFLIATAMKHGLIVITEENPQKLNKIPKACEMLGVDCTSILGLCERERWTF